MKNIKKFENFEFSEIQPEEGYDIQTTININLQDVAESALEKHLKQHFWKGA
jgi:cell division protein FtsI (penicillin-binding protein 3)